MRQVGKRRMARFLPQAVAEQGVPLRQRCPPAARLPMQQNRRLEVRSSGSLQHLRCTLFYTKL